MNDKPLNKPASPAACSWDLILFFALYTVMPSYCAVELHSAIPLITVSRGVLVLLGLMTLLRSRKELGSWRGWNFTVTENRMLRWGLLIYFVLLLISDIALFPADKSESIKAIFLLLTEEYMLVWLLSLAIDTRKKLETALAALSVATGVVGVLAVVGTLIEFNPFHLLNTVQRDMLMTEYYRLGALRAEAGFGHPVFYGAFCVVMTPIIMYFVEFSPKRWQRLIFAISLSFNLSGLFLSNSRGSQLVIVILMLIIVLVRIMRRRMKAFLKTYIPVLLVTGVILAVTLASMPHGEYFLAMTVYSLWNEMFPGSMIAMPTAPTDPTGTVPVYGENPSGTRSRLVQLTGVWRTLKERPVFGYGSNANSRGLIYYQFVEGQWWPGGSFDMGLVSVICQYGIVGLLGYGAMYASVFLTTARQKYRNDELMHALGLAFVAYMGCMFVISSLGKMLWVLIGAIVCLVNIMDREAGSR